jgi:hypothetical protein
LARKRLAAREKGVAEVKAPFPNGWAPSSTSATVGWGPRDVPQERIEDPVCEGKPPGGAGEREEENMTYVDGFVIPVPKKNLAAYKKMAAGGAKVWKKHGALETSPRRIATQ